MALVEAAAGEACASCSSRGSCSLVAGERKRRLWMRNSAPARPGDSVEFSIPPRAVVRTSLLLYALPVALLVAGIAAGVAAAPRLGVDGDTAAAIFGAAAFALSYGIIKLCSVFMAGRESSRPVMIRVSGKDTDEE